MVDDASLSVGEFDWIALALSRNLLLCVVLHILCTSTKHLSCLNHLFDYAVLYKLSNTRIFMNIWFCNFLINILCFFNIIEQNIFSKFCLWESYVWCSHSTVDSLHQQKHDMIGNWLVFVVWCFGFQILLLKFTDFGLNCISKNPKKIKK